ncbi:MAG: hypothetical protein ABSF20_01405 [Smithella sp.]
MNRPLKWLIATIAGFAIIAYGISFLWPGYDWDLRVPSPDGRYDLVVLRGDTAAFADFSYHIYVFPHALAPHDQTKASRVWLTPMWRGKKFLVYSGYNYPMFRWTGTHSVEIDFTDLYPEPCTVEPVKSFGEPKHNILVSVVFGKENISNTLP